jgi:predicted nucleotidyltransferase
MKSNLLKKHKNNIHKIAISHGVRSIQVFGSFARGEENIDSDIDFLIELEPKRSLLDIIALKYDIEDLTGRKVDVVTADGISPYLVNQIMKEAVPL